MVESLSQLQPREEREYGQQRAARMPQATPRWQLPAQQEVFVVVRRPNQDGGVTVDAGTVRRTVTSDLSHTVVSVRAGPEETPARLRPASAVPDRIRRTLSEELEGRRNRNAEDESLRATTAAGTGEAIHELASGSGSRSQSVASVEVLSDVAHNDIQEPDSPRQPS